MVQYCSGGKWGLLLRRPLEAMSRTLWLSALDVICPSLIFMKNALPSGRSYSNPNDVAQALEPALIARSRRHALNFKHPMLNPASVWVQIVICFAIWASATCSC